MARYIKLRNITIFGANFELNSSNINLDKFSLMVHLAFIMIYNMCVFENITQIKKIKSIY
jgi:hypothetical protein